MREPRRPKRYHHGDLPRALVDAALHIVETQGTEALTLRAAARSAGVSQAAPYRHFTNKEAILAAVAEEERKLARRGDVMGLDVEDELARRLPLIGGRRLYRLDRIDLEERPEHRVQREEGRRHSRAGSEELAPAHPEPARASSRVLIE